MESDWQDIGGYVGKALSRRMENEEYERWFFVSLQQIQNQDPRIDCCSRKLRHAALSVPAEKIARLVSDSLIELGKNVFCRNSRKLATFKGVNPAFGFCSPELI